MANEPQVPIVGNLVADPEPRVSQTGKPWVTFKVANTPRVRDRQSGDWSDGDALFVDCRAYGKIAENIAASFAKGMRVFVYGRLTQRNYTDKNNNQRSSMQLEVEYAGPELTFATASVSSARSGGPAGGGYAPPPAEAAPRYGSTPGSGYAAAPNPHQQQSGGFGNGFDGEETF